MIPSNAAQDRALRALTRPSRRRTGGPVGDGPPCPVTRSHGPTFTLRSGAVHCSHHSHDGVTRATWRLDADGRIVP